MFRPLNQDKRLQRLLLLAVRDGADPAELARYTRYERVFNAAVLIREGYVHGRIIENSDGTISTAMTRLTPKGHEFVK